MNYNDINRKLEKNEHLKKVLSNIGPVELYRIRKVEKESLNETLKTFGSKKRAWNNEADAF